MLHSETERQFYLGVAGVRLWYAREALPGAAPSPEFQFDDPEPEAPLVPHAPAAGPSAEAVRPGAGGASRQQAGVAQVANLQALMEETAPGGRPRPESDPVPRKSAVAPTDDDGAGARPATAPNEVNDVAPALNLQVWSGRKVALVASLSDEASLRLQQTLAENILKSIGEVSVQPVGPVRWPVFNNRRAPGNSLNDLRAVLSHVLSTFSDHTVIALGVAAPEHYDGDTDWLRYISGTNPDLSFPHSLAELASNPVLKRALWQELKPLADK